MAFAAQKIRSDFKRSFWISLRIGVASFFRSSGKRARYSSKEDFIWYLVKILCMSKPLISI